MQDPQSEERPDEKAAPQSVPLVLPEGIRYSCQGCGKCCCGWSIGLSYEDYANVKDVDWASKHPDLAGPLFVNREKEFEQGLSQYPIFTVQREDGRCAFLINDLCFIHSTLGAESKPRTCQIFPYSFNATPSGIYAGVVYNSAAAVRNLGTLLSEQAPMLEQMWRTVVAHQHAQGKASDAVTGAAASVTSADLSAIQYNVNLTAASAITWEQYLLIEARLLEILQSSDNPNFATALLLCTDLLAKAVGLKQQGRLEEICSCEPDIGSMKGAVASDTECVVLRTIYFKLFEYPQIRLKYGRAWELKRKNPFFQPVVWNAALKTVASGTIELSTPAKVNAENARKLQIGTLSDEVISFLRRYLYLKIFTKSYCGPPCAGFSVVSGFNNLISYFLCGLVYAKAQAVCRGDSEIKLSDLYEAFFTIDRESIQINQLPKDRASFYDLGFSSARLFSRHLSEMSRTLD
jgi:Fe-S-cluster containining protein